MTSERNMLSTSDCNNIIFITNGNKLKIKLPIYLFNNSKLLLKYFEEYNILYFPETELDIKTIFYYLFLLLNIIFLLILFLHKYDENNKFKNILMNIINHLLRLMNIIIFIKFYH